jgi:exo-beta-1,3-glucanase (GH17 family)
LQESINHIFKYGRAICYSGFREGQQPGFLSPTYEQIKEDLYILKDHWQYLRLYDCDPHSETVLEVIQKENLDFKVMLGAYIVAERNNAGGPWGGNAYTEIEQDKNATVNRNQIEKLIRLANKYPDIINALSAGNEACVDWTDHYVPVDIVVEYVKLIKQGAKQPVTFCENYLPWIGHMRPLAEVVDFISIHTYPVWEYKNIHEAIEYTKENYNLVANAYPDTPVIITEAGWATNSNGRGIEKHNVSQRLQRIYYNDLMEWTDREKIITYVFEAFDETWKGSAHPLEPEKHWGLFNMDRTPKQVVRNLTTQKI